MIIFDNIINETGTIEEKKTVFYCVCHVFSKWLDTWLKPFFENGKLGYSVEHLSPDQFLIRMFYFHFSVQKGKGIMSVVSRDLHFNCFACYTKITRFV